MKAQLQNKTASGIAPKTLGANNIQIGDVLVRENDHLGRHDHKVTVTSKHLNPAIYGLLGYWREDETAKSLSAQGYKIVERNGNRYPFFVRYW